jgi:hypothetical protein
LLRILYIFVFFFHKETKLEECKTNLEYEIKTLKTDYNRKIMKYHEEYDEVKGHNALIQNEISLLNANLTNLTQEKNYCLFSIFFFSFIFFAFIIILIIENSLSLSII